MTIAVVRALRGATTCPVDTPDTIASATQELLKVMMERNDLAHDDIISMLFTTSPDLRSAFPAAGARGIGFGDVPLLCASEIDVPGAMANCVRILMHVYTKKLRTELHHVYLHDARALRDDLPD